MGWGTHGAMGELKPPLGMMSDLCLVPCDLGHSGLGGHPATMLVAKTPASALFLVTFGHSVVGGPCFLVLFSLLGFVASCLFLFVLVRAC